MFTVRRCHQPGGKAAPAGRDNTQETALGAKRLPGKLAKIVFTRNVTRRRPIDANLVHPLRVGQQKLLEIEFTLCAEKARPDVPIQQNICPAKRELVHEHLDREQAVVFQAFSDVGVSPDASIVAEVLDEILSDMSGPLFKAVREDQSLAYYVGASRLLSHDFGCFYLFAGTHPSTTDQVLECFENEITRIRNGELSDHEIEAARTKLKIGNRFSLQSPATRATKVTLNALYGKAPMAWLEYEDRLNAISGKDLVQFAQKHLDPEKSLRLLVTPN